MPRTATAQTPLFEAAAAGHREAAELLLQSGADAGSDMPPGLPQKSSHDIWW